MEVSMMKPMDLTIRIIFSSTRSPICRTQPVANCERTHIYSINMKWAGPCRFIIFSTGTGRAISLWMVPQRMNITTITIINNDSTYDKVKFKSVRNEVGIKGDLLKLFYNGYYAIRDYTFTNNNIDTLGTQVSGVESYIGGRMSLHLDSIGEVTGWGELQQNGNFRIEGQIKSRWFEASVKQVQYSPALLLQRYRGSHDDWSNDFSNQNATQVNGYLHYNSKVLRVSPGLTFTRLGNYIFFKEDTVRIDTRDNAFCPCNRPVNR